MACREKIKVRHIKDGGWYWIGKAILKCYGQKLKPSGIAVYNALAFYANSNSQSCFPTQKVIGDLIGASRRTVSRKIIILRELGLIAVHRIKSRYKYVLLKPDEKKNLKGSDKRNTFDVTIRNTNKNYITRINIKNIDNKNFPNSKIQAFKPRTREELLALDIAKELNELRALPLYLSYTKKYPESLLRKVLGEVKEIPFEKINKSRGALFNYLIQKYAQKANKNHRD